MDLKDCTAAQIERQAARNTSLCQRAISASRKQSGTKVDEIECPYASPVGTAMTGSIIEVGRLEGPDLAAIKATGSAGKTAAGIKAAIDAFINQ